MINLKINNIPVSVEEGTTICEAARVLGIKIPTLCHMKELNEIGACRICVVEVVGMKNLVASCVYPVREGMEVLTNTPKVIYSRKTTIELILSDHRKDCLSCERNTNCELQSLAYKYGCDATRFIGKTRPFTQDTTTDYLVRDNSKCILCRRCVAVCHQQQQVGVIGANDRGFATHIGCAFDLPLNSISCIGCGQCINVCPTGALKERSEVGNVIDALGDKTKTVIVGAAPSVRVALAEEFGAPVGSDCLGKMYRALKIAGFDKVFDINFGADFTIMEEGYELIDRIKNNKTLPMFTSCCPGWIRFVEFYYPDLIPNLSTCKSPQQMFGALVKTYYAQKTGLDPENIYTVAIMPCTAKKFEKVRDGEDEDGQRDIDAVLTTRELARLLMRNGIQLLDLEDDK
ncbi:MAG: [Fe-Fe] hydrogenase large subunit C-terminal domain-containing protein, partial [Clostridia bacterium]